ncbi:site-specific recombinase [Acinetobacter sp. MD2(2019)]|uniref:site-specific recombinase n=1 Tax=Acinetobacter sp. MD2(2019) TaxID=2605273 RepID=UPI002D1E634B|nr:site-specific recombinase [Acinetobacter sp. MD2(2019)]MEB3753912.1 site-specific recombinase [Acinetobacter sp. MD2(2019)]
MINQSTSNQLLQQIRTSIQQQLDSSVAAVNEQPLVDFIEVLRPKNTKDNQEIQQNISTAIQIILQTPDFSNLLHQYILKLITQYKQTKLYADSGILSLDGFWDQLGQRLVSRILPPLEDDTQLQDLITKVFYKPSDRYWLERIDANDWALLFGLFDQGLTDPNIKNHLQHSLIKAINVLSYRISGIGLFPELIYAEPKLTEYESPFIAQNREMLQFIQQLNLSIQQGEQHSESIPDAAAVFVMIEQCKDVVTSIRRATKRIGVSLNLTYLLTVLEQSLDRLEVLLQLINPVSTARTTASKELLSDLVKAIHNEKSVGALLSANSELLALQVTENASKTGEHYVSSDKKGFFGMYRAAAGAGFIIAIMATIKILFSRLVLSPFMYAFSYSMNYALGFVFIHLLHFTVATKQPAMTAAALASTVQHRKGSKTAQLAELAELIVNIIRTQFIAILGNISIAIPTAGIITYLWPIIWHEPLLNTSKAAYTLHALDPFTSLAVPHAAIAGVCLFLSGLIAGYFDNMAIYRKIGPRIKAHKGLHKLLGEERQNQFADYIERNLGALAGNFLFGIMLGSIGTIGFILGLPFDIRHIAFASANLIQGLMCIQSPDIGIILVSILGVILIGLTNLFVSFSLTIIVALRARRVRFEQWNPLAKLVLTHFFTRPSDFFWPPKNDSHIQHSDPSSKH